MTDFVRNFSWQFFYSQNYCRKSAERKSPKKYFFYFVLMSGLGGSNPGFSFNKPTHYLLDYEDFKPEKERKLFR